MKISYNRNSLIRAQIVEYLIIFLLSVCSLDSEQGRGFFIFCMILSLGWLVIFCLANDVIGGKPWERSIY